MRNQLKKIIWPFLPKPWNSPIMEFKHGLWNGVSALLSESGRQLGEENTRPFTLNQHLQSNTIISRYNDSRIGKPINMSALLIAMKNFDMALSITGSVRQFHMKKIDRTTENSIPGIWDLYIISRASIAIIAYQQRHRGTLTSSDSVSDALASQYQFISGVFMICREMMNMGDAAITTNAPISGKDLYNYADNNDIFISFNGMACAGSVMKIMEFLEFCNNGQVKKNNSATCTDNHTDKFTDMHSLLSDPDNWYEYAVSTIELDCFIELERLQRMRNLKSSPKADLDKIEDIYKSLSNYCTSILCAPPFPEITKENSFADAALLRQNNLLTILGKTNIDIISEKSISERLGI